MRLDPPASTPPGAASDTIAGRLLGAMGRRDGEAMRYWEGGRWRTLSYRQLESRVRALARGLVALGVEPGDRVAIFSNTRAEWTLADLAVLWTGAAVVPVYQTSSAEECEYVVGRSGARIVFCEDREQLQKVESVRSRLPELEHVVAFTEPDGVAIPLDVLAGYGDAVDDAEIDSRVAALRPTDPCAVVYTSGTTGAPKGCVLTHGNVLANVEMIRRRLPFGSGPKSVYLWLPLAHVLARIVQFSALDQGAELAYWRRDPRKLLEDIADIQPTHLPSVPRLFEKIHTAARAAVQGRRLKTLLFDWAIRVGRRWQLAREQGGGIGRLLALQHRVADRLVLRSIRRPFGSRLEFAVTGAAPVDPEILRFFHAAGVYVLEGYGMTEATAVATVNTIGERRFGTVGKPLPGCVVRLAEDGEVLVRGPHVFAGYFADEIDGDHPVVDGWLHSGDLGSIDPDGFLTITGRKKDLIITASGKNITPASIEAALEQHRWISHAVVYGDRRPYLTALITLDPAEAPGLARQLDLEADLVAMAGDERVRAEIQGVVDAANSRFAGPEQIRRFVILERDLSEEEGELTPTAKVRRAVVQQNHGHHIDALYEKAGA